MSRMTDEYGEFKQTHADFLNGVFEARARLQKMFSVDREGATKLMLFWAASCLNFGSSCRTKYRKKFDEVLVEGWDSPDKFQKYCERLGKMGINMGGGYEGDDKELVYIKVEGDHIGKAGHNNYVFCRCSRFGLTKRSNSPTKSTRVASWRLRCKVSELGY